jgi:chaperone modulatory protein CbpM
MTGSKALMAELIEDTCALDLATLSRLCRLDEAWLIELVEAGLLKPAGPETRPQHWRFDGIQLGRARRAYRLQRDFEASQAALALMMQLLDEVERLQRLLPR